MAINPLTDTEIEEISQELAETPKQAIITPATVGIRGLEDIPASLIPLPWVKLVQPTSQNVSTNDGKDAPIGSFYFSDTQEVDDELQFSILKAKHGESTFKRGNETIRGFRIVILGVRLKDTKPFVLTLSVMSFTSFGQLMSKLKAAGATKSWEYSVKATSEKQENDKGKYYTIKFELGDKLPVEQTLNLEEKYLTYADSFNRVGQTNEEIPF